MVSHYNNYWCFNIKDNWVKITLIVTLVTIVFGLILITLRICSRRSSSHIYKPCLCLHSDSVYVPTTCAFKDGRYEGIDEGVNSQGEEEHVIIIAANDASVVW